jgi:hypothetical protein
MTNKSLPAYLQQVLAHHVAKSELSDDQELQQIFERLNRLNEKVESHKAQILQRKASISHGS